MSWTIVNFGKHKGKTLPQIVLKDPDWFFWAMEDSVFEKRGRLKQEANEICGKATKILIRKRHPEKWDVEYILDFHTGKFVSMEIVRKTDPRQSGTVRRKYINLSVPRGIVNYDKFGGALLIKCFKFCVFGKSNYKLTKKRCEAFFDDDKNFDESVRTKAKIPQPGFFRDV